MNIQKHHRINQIKSMSQYLYFFLTCIHFLLCLAPIFLAWLIFKEGKGNFTYLGVNLNIEDLTSLQRILITTHLFILLLFILKTIYHFRELIWHFSKGNIFNRKAIENARKALFSGLFFYVFYLVSLFSIWIYLSTQQQPISIVIDGSLALGLIFFGLMYVLLWSLEIGADLNEESELTI